MQQEQHGRILRAGLAVEDAYSAGHGRPVVRGC
jgi:hypothetical protein